MPTPREEMERAARAKEVVEHPLWIETWETLEARCRQQWENSEASEIEAREEAYRMLLIARKVKRSFETVIQTGKMAEMALEKENGRAQRS